MTYCEDAPCCGCCTPRALGWYDEPDYDSFYERDYDEPDACDGGPEDCPYGGCSDCDEQEDGTWDGYEDAAMESALFGDC